MLSHQLLIPARSLSCLLQETWQMSREKCWQCQRASPGAPGSWGGKAIPALSLPSGTALSWGPAASGGMIRTRSHLLWCWKSCRTTTLPSLPSSTLPSCHSLMGAVVLLQLRLHSDISDNPILQPHSTPTHTGVSRGGSCLQPVRSEARTVLPAMSSGTPPAQTPVTRQDICPLHLL